MPFVTLLILAATLATYLAGNPLELALWPIGSAEFRLWQLVTYAFVHGGVLHVVVNMLALVTFGPVLERAWGHRRFLCCYALAAAIGGVIQACVAQLPTVGASAALFGLFAAWVVANPKRKVFSLVPWPLEAWKVLLVYVVASAAAWAFGWFLSVGHAAHLGGVVVGLAWGANEKPRR